MTAASRSPVTGGKSARDIALHGELGGADQPFGARQRGVDDVGDVERPQSEPLLTMIGGREEEDLLNQGGQLAHVVSNDRPVLLHLLLTLDDALSDVVGCRADDGQRSAQLMRDGRDEVELQLRQALGTIAGSHEHPHADNEQ